MSKYTIKECVEKYREVCNNRDFKGTNIFRFSKIYPKDTKFIFGYIEAPGSGDRPLEWRIHVVGTVPLSANEVKSIENRLRRHICSRMIPHGGRSVFKETPSKFGILKIHTKNEDGTFSNIPVLCTEKRPDGSICNGIFIPDTIGDNVCQNCGIIHEWRFTDNSSSDDTVDEASLPDESEYRDVILTDNHIDNSNAIFYDATWKPPLERYITSLGGMPLSGHYGEIERRSEIASEAWKESLKIRPQDEINSRTKARDQKTRHDFCKAYNRKHNTPSHQTLIYQGKWRDLQAKARLGRILQLVKLGINDKIGIRKFLNVGISSKTFYRDLAKLVLEGKIVIVKDQYNHKIIKLTAPPRPPRIPPEQVLKQPKQRDPKDIPPSVKVYFNLERCYVCGQVLDTPKLEEFKTNKCTHCIGEYYVGEPRYNSIYMCGLWGHI